MGCYGHIENGKKFSTYYVADVSSNTKNLLNHAITKQSFVGTRVSLGPTSRLCNRLS